MEQKFMKQTYTVRCSDCGSLALRTHLVNYPHSPTTKTECPSCDYLLITCSNSGRVIDTHSSIASIVTRKTQPQHFPIAIAVSPRKAA